MGKIIINADDFGYCESVNYGIIEAHKKGVVSSTTVMANMPGFEHGVKLLKSVPTLACGVHMTLTCYKPVLKTHKTLVDSDGNFFRRPTHAIIENMDLDELYAEFCAQIDKAKTFVDVSHLDSHHHVHVIDRFRPVIERVAKKYNLPIRGDLGLKDVRQVKLMGTFYAEKASPEWFEENIEKFKQYDVVDIMSHPAYIEKFLYNSTSYNMQRMTEFTVLTDPRVKDILKKNNIEIITYKNLPSK